MWYIILFFLVMIALYALFFFHFCIIALLKKIQQQSSVNSYTHFAIIVPARNEENVIRNLISSLQSQDYPKDAYDIYIVVNNSTDHTKEIVQKEHVHCIEPTCTTSTKGEILDNIFT